MAKVVLRNVCLFTLSPDGFKASLSHQKPFNSIVCKASRLNSLKTVIDSICDRNEWLKGME